MFLGLYLNENDVEKLQAIKDAIKKIDSNIELITDKNSMVLTFDNYFIHDCICNALEDNGFNSNSKTIKDCFTYVMSCFNNNYDGSEATDDIGYFITECVYNFMQDKQQ